ncbi:MAG: DUF1343 domain-containing protein [Bacteroidaceae bacterium]|nr:DUF1343 domain-containing protein [Bacteroidaceae bacterium]
MHRLFLFISIALLLAPVTLEARRTKDGREVITGDLRTKCYIPMLKGKRVALYSNHTGLAGKEHVLDLLLREGIDVACIFSPEHGFRGTADAGEGVGSGKDEKTGVTIVSLYGQPMDKALASAPEYDVLVADIQDVGLRYYTYYVTLCRLMDACAETDKPVIVLDRPNPNGHFVDGPILDMSLRSGVGWLPIPVVHGLTLGELALMANGEGWLKDGHKCRLTVIPCKHYTHGTRYSPPVPPSPNLPNIQSILLYPSLCYFEASDVSVGRGTEKPFQLYGHPQFTNFTFRFLPQSRPGAKKPTQQDKWCFGEDLSQLSLDSLYRKHIDLTYLVTAYRILSAQNQTDKRVLTSFFEKLMGSKDIRRMLDEGYDAKEIKKTWQGDVERFKIQRKPYLLYKE